MNASPLEKELLKYTKGLPKDALQEILDFIKFIRQKRIDSSSTNVKEELSSLNSSQAVHIEEEFKDYKQRYPSENE